MLPDSFYETTFAETEGGKPLAEAVADFLKAKKSRESFRPLPCQPPPQS